MTTLLTADNVDVRLGGHPIVAHASIALARGELVALVGPNGAGKTTLTRALAGLLPATGAITLEGRPLAAFAARDRARRIAYLPQGNVFHWPIPVASVVALGRYPHADPFSPPSAEDDAAVADALAATATTELADRIVTTLSGGERARVALARALATRAPVLLADEPIVSLDARHQFIVMNVLRQAAHAGNAVLTVVHDLTLAARFADRVVVMEKGHVVADAPPADALTPDRMAAVFGVESTLVDFGDGLFPLVRRPL